MRFHSFAGSGLLALSSFLPACATTPAPLELRVSSEQKDSSPQRYALLLAGTRDSRHSETLAGVYCSLLSLGYSPQNIYILEADGTRAFFFDHATFQKRKSSSDPPYPVDGAATQDNFFRLLDFFYQHLDDDDKLFLYFTGHGDIFNSSSAYLLGDHIPFFSRSSVDHRELARRLLQNTCTTFGVFDYCYGGDLTSLLAQASPKNLISLSAAAPGKKSYGRTFARAFLEGLSSSETDANHDWRISVREIYDFIRRHDINVLNGNQQPTLSPVLTAENFFIE